MSERIQIIKGFTDVLPPESGKWRRLEDAARGVFACYGFEEARLPLLERTELFARGIGETTDIVAKEMYSFLDRKGRSLSLRPEGTASAVRAYLASGKGKGEPVKWYYLGPMFRYERPQKGRYRQFYQIGAEAIGYPGPGTDAELLALVDRFFQAAGLRGLRLELNSLGCPRCRPAYRQALLVYLEGQRDRLCPDCRERLVRNPLRVLDCKEESCREAVREAPAALDFLDDDCRGHFAKVREDLDLIGLAYTVNPRIVRGLDYYTRTVFEFVAESGLGAQNAVAAGGRYDGLVEQFGGPPTPAIGFAIGVDRAVILLGDRAAPAPDFFIVAAGERARAEGIKLLHELRARGCLADMITDGESRSLKAQMKAAAKAGARQAVVIGDRELDRGVYAIKDLVSAEQVELPARDFLARFGKIKEEGSEG